MLEEFARKAHCYSPPPLQYPLLQELKNNEVKNPLMGERLLIDKLILVYEDQISIHPEDAIAFVKSGREAIYLYLLHAEPYLCNFLKGGLEIKISQPLFIDTLVSYKVQFHGHYRLYISGLLYKSQ